MRIFYLSIVMFLIACGSSQAAITQLSFYSTVSSFRPSATSPVSPGMEAKLVVTYNSDQLEDREPITGDPTFDGISNASSSYTISDYSAYLIIGSYT
jgi:hypothetical protein